MVVSSDWDDTIVDARTQEWLPANEGDIAPLDALKTLLRNGHRVIINTCRANWPEGHASVEAKLQAAGLDVTGRLSVWTGAGKPHADVYADNLSFPPFEGQWRALLAHVARTPPVPRGTTVVPARYQRGAARRGTPPTTATFPNWPGGLN